MWGFFLVLGFWGGFSAVSYRAVGVFTGLYGPAIQEDTCNHMKDPLGHVPQRCGSRFLKIELGDVVAVIRYLGHHLLEACHGQGCLMFGIVLLQLGAELQHLGHRGELLQATSQLDSQLLKLTHTISPPKP